MTAATKVFIYNLSIVLVKCNFKICFTLHFNVQLLILALQHQPIGHVVITKLENAEKTKGIVTPMLIAKLVSNVE